LLSGVPARTDVRARVTALTLLVLPVLTILSTAAAVLRGSESHLVVAYGTMLATFGVALGASTSLSVDGAFPMPESRNPFAMRSGTGTGKSLLMLVVMAATLICTVPLYVAAFFVPAWTVLPIGAAWGLGGALIGTTIAAARLSRRGPELLLAVTPRR
jgi:ABC-2 type transport system permease protein